MSQTKVAKIIETFHNNELFLAVLKAVIEDDDQAFEDAVRSANLDDQDVVLSDIEFDNLVKGVKPSGELDIITWEGYYEVNTLQDNDPHAFLILSTTQQLYWGLRSQILLEPENHVINYSVTTDGKLTFSTSVDGAVSLSLSRTYDDTAISTKVNFSGTMNEQSMSGGQVVPPFTEPDSKARAVFFDDPDSESAFWESVWQYFTNGVTIFGFGATVWQTYLWIKEARDKRAERSRMLRKRLEDEPLLGVTVERTAGSTITIDFGGASGALTDTITTRVNGKLYDGTIDFENQDVNSIIQDLRELARSGAVESLGKYIKMRVGSQILSILQPFRTLNGYESIETTVLDGYVDSQVNIKLREIGNENSAYDPLLRTLTLQARYESLLANYNKLEVAYNGAQSAYESARGKREQTQTDIDAINEEIENAESEEDKERLEERRKQLEQELETLEAEEQERLTELEDAQAEKDEAEKKSDDAKNDEETDHSMDEWDGKMEGVFGEK